MEHFKFGRLLLLPDSESVEVIFTAFGGIANKNLSRVIHNSNMNDITMILS
jgi:hypothetical protein